MGEGARYRLTALLGKGAMGEVLRADDVTLDREVAVKRIDPGLKSERASRRFAEEARITARLDHPGIVPIYTLDRDADGELAYAMKLVRGRTLEGFLAEARACYAAGSRPTGELALAGRLEVFLHVLDTVGYAHERGYLHRDLKPENVMVSGFGEVHVMDWGLARAIGPGGEDLSTEGQVVGTPAFMSPEQADGQSDTLDGRSDLFSLGLMLFEVVTLREARGGGAFEAVMRQVMAGRRNPIQHVSPRETIPRELRAIIERATAPVRADRYASVAELAADLRRFLRDESVAADPDRGWRRVRRWIGRNRTKTLIAGVVLVLVLAIVVVVLQWRASEALRAQEEAERAREARLQEVHAVVAAQATRMNERLHDFEGLLRELAADAARILNEAAPDAQPTLYVYSSAGSEPRDAPAGARPTAIYRVPVSYDEADFLVAGGLDRRVTAATAARLARLTPTLRRVLLASGRTDAHTLSPAQGRALVLEEGVPLVWSYVATEDGVAVGFPGSWIYKPDAGEASYDPRRMPWYRAAPRDDTRSTWLGSGVDENGLGLLVTCVRAVRDNAGAFLGVAAIDLTFEYVIAHLLEVPALARAGAEAFVVDAAGRVVVRSSERAFARDASRYVPAPFPDPAVREAIRDLAQGHLARPDGTLVLWAPIVSTGWSYVVVGGERELLRSRDP